ncbi:hypothetical protein DE146DRAFT_655348 [Phaeosphaeria sp. MPI-PUGE-AT-0046c]|nr:hypothetical protein DE146DRAFT_655348 [Phaeosphaeria sp. MPI-PUGE-AT-0046c]
MSSAMISQTLQGAVLSMTSNVLAQAISSYKDSTPFSLNPGPIIKFVIFSIISNPPNIIWQSALENQFPTSVPVTTKSGEKKSATKVETRTSKTNILIKFILDQTIGALVNTLMFLAYIAYVNASQQGKTDPWGAVVKDCSERTWPMMKDGYKFWPAISLISFVWVPVDKRVVFGCSVGVIWGIYLSLAVDA